MKRVTAIFPSLLFALCMFTFGYAFADEAVVLAPQDFFSQVIEFIKAFGGLPMMAKISGGVALVISTMKVTFLNDLLWSKLGRAKAWAAPVLGLVAGITALGVDGKITLAGVMAWVGAGAGAVIIHELLDTVKAIPGLGPVWVRMIDFVQRNLGGPKTSSDTKISAKAQV